MFFTKPLLDPPAPGWKRDLPMPDLPPSTDPYPPVLPHPPNYLDSVYLELPRSAYRKRGLCACVAVVLILLAIFSLLIGGAYILATASFLPLVPSLGMLLSSISGFWLGIYAWRMTVQAPPRRTHPLQPLAPQSLCLSVPSRWLTPIQPNCLGCAYGGIRLE